jgi:hypothetical protein
MKNQAKETQEMLHDLRVSPNVISEIRPRCMRQAAHIRSTDARKMKFSPEQNIIPGIDWRIILKRGLKK